MTESRACVSQICLTSSAAPFAPSSACRSLPRRPETKQNYSFSSDVRRIRYRNASGFSNGDEKNISRWRLGTNVDKTLHRLRWRSSVKNLLVSRRKTTFMYTTHVFLFTLFLS